MNKFIIIVFVVLQFGYSQEKCKIITSQETINISFDKTLKIESLVQESRYIPKSKNTNDYTVRIPFNSFNEIKNIEGFTYNPATEKKSTTLNVQEYEINQEDIFHSDYKFKYFVFPNVEDNCNVQYSYKNKYKEPRLLSIFEFQNDVYTEKAIFRIVCDRDINIGHKIFGDNSQKVSYSVKQDQEKTIHEWQANSLEAFEREPTMCAENNYKSHLVYWIESYKTSAETIAILGAPKTLYQWYSSLVKDINKRDNSELKSKTAELIAGKTTDLEKAKAVFQWVQIHLNYVAFEFGMGGFVPRDAMDVFQKKYGDCKDMANLINEMMLLAGIKSNLTWIGTRVKSYDYTDIATPIVDNHMIASALINNKRYYFDATDKYCQFQYPSQMIQGKQAMIGISATEFLIEKVPVEAPERNRIKTVFNLKIKDNVVTGDVNTQISGINKSDLLNKLSSYNSKEQEIWKSMVNATNEKISLETTSTDRKDYLEEPAVANFNLSISDWIKTLNNKILFKPMLIYPYVNYNIDIEKRKFGMDLSSTDYYEISYQYQIPAGFAVDFIPENMVFENDLGKLELRYVFENNILKIMQNITVKAIDFGKNEFVVWNDFIKKITKNCNQSVVLIKV